MKLIKTNDGMFGWKIADKVIWCDSMQEVCSIGWSHVGRIKVPHEKERFLDEVNFAVDCMTSSGHSLANFGIFGNFITTELE